LARTALLSLLPAALIATGWRQLEFPAEGRALGLVALLGVGVALLPRRWLQWLGAAGASLLVVRFAFGLSSVRGVLGDAWNGVLDFYEIALPFDPGQRERMHGIVLVAVFAFTLFASLAIARRRAILASAITFAGAAWPVTLIRDAPSTARGALLLVAALLLLAALRAPESRRVSRQTALVGAAVLLAALVAVSSPAVAKGGFLNWEQWEPYTRDKKPVSVSYVWDADYDGIQFPKEPTTVLTIKAPRRVSYWRATTLDYFLDDHWNESSLPVFPVAVDDRDALIDDPYVPARARNPERWMEQEVRVRALRDTHLVGATMPIAFEEDAAAIYSSGVAHVGSLVRDQRYKVWSWVPQPGLRQLASSPPDYPDDVETFLRTPSGFAPPFGTPQREPLMRELLSSDTGDDPRYDRLYDLALGVAGRPRSPYAAVVALEAWFRSGLFVYDESPPVRRGVPPLLTFLERDRQGYCQHFAGAMALMLRYLGIPARVGAGFTTGRYNDERGEWTVADKNAHTWVEAWFAGYGWLPFDPTPGRGRLQSTYTTSSFTFDVSGAQGLLAGLGEAGREALEGSGGPNRGANNPRGLDPAGRSAGGDADSSGRSRFGSSLVALALMIAAGLTAGLWTLKVVRRRIRYLTRDPRRLAGAIRLDLVEFLVDQRLAISSSATPAEVGRELERSVDIRGDGLAEELARARYGPEAGAAEAAARAKSELRTIRRRIRRRLGIGERLRGLLSLRSLGLGSS
jgi:protein-glutamine gamma-glutamyltransferase